MNYINIKVYILFYFEFTERVVFVRELHVPSFKYHKKSVD